MIIESTVKDLEFKTLPVEEDIHEFGAMVGMPTTYITFSPNAGSNTTLLDLLKECKNYVVTLIVNQEVPENLDILIKTLRVNDKFVVIACDGTTPIEVETDWISCYPDKHKNYSLHSEFGAGEYIFLYDEDMTMESLPDYVKNCTCGGAIWIASPIDLQNEAYNFVMENPKLRLCWELNKDGK